jgi:serine/threonine protein kinase
MLNLHNQKGSTYLQVTSDQTMIQRTNMGALYFSKLLMQGEGWRKYLKIALVWWSRFFTPFSFYLSILYEPRETALIIFRGKSGRVKRIFKNSIENPVQDNPFSKRDFWMRIRVKELDISPKIIKYSDSFFEEELLATFKTVSDIEEVKLIVKNLIQHFHQFPISVKAYYQNRVRQLEHYRKFPKPFPQVSGLGDEQVVWVVMSHGDLIPRNVLKQDGKIKLIDFEFSGYRFSDYDALYYEYFINRKQFLNRTFGLKECLFCLDRLLLVTRIQHHLKIDYSEEIEILYRSAYDSVFNLNS